MSGPARVDQVDLQGNVLCSYNARQTLFAFVRVEEARAGRAWLGELASGVTNAVPWAERKPARTLNVALSCAGLRAVGVPERLLGSFPEDFRAGMRARAVLLGDDGGNDPARWDAGLDDRESHVLVTVGTWDARVAAREREALLSRVASDPGLRAIHEVAAATLGDPAGGESAREHFGFADGFAQPAIRDPAAGPTTLPGQGTPTRDGRWEELAPGEFVLGYADEDGVVADMPAEPLRRSGSYAVVRKLRQAVGSFHRYLRDVADGDPRRAEWLAAKIVGRWRDGSPLALAPERPDSALAADRRRVNDFLYGGDPHGFACPLGAHVRRANPRDALGWHGTLTKRHRIVRRGMPYGEAAPEPLEADDEAEDRGLMFVCYQASIARQFEVVQGSWLSDGDTLGLGSDADFLLGCDDRPGKLTIQGRPPRFLAPMQRFVTLRGGGYFFTPGIAALRRLANGL